MPIITRISTQNRKNRFNVEVDGEFAFGASDVLLARENLYKGKEIGIEEIERLKQAAEEEKMYEKALHFLSYRPRSKKEVELHLKKKSKDFRSQIPTSVSTPISISISTSISTTNYELPTTNCFMICALWDFGLKWEK